DSGQLALAECVLRPAVPIANRQSPIPGCVLRPGPPADPGRILPVRDGIPELTRSGQPGGDAWKELAFARYNTRNRLIPQSCHPLPATFGSPSLESRGSPQRSLQGMGLFLREDFQSAGP